MTGCTVTVAGVALGVTVNAITTGGYIIRQHISDPSYALYATFLGGSNFRAEDLYTVLGTAFGLSNPSSIGTTDYLANVKVSVFVDNDMLSSCARFSVFRMVLFFCVLEATGNLPSCTSCNGVRTSGFVGSRALLQQLGIMRRPLRFVMGADLLQI